jgi:hypothetical protein
MLINFGEYNREINSLSGPGNSTYRMRNILPFVKLHYGIIVKVEVIKESGPEKCAGTCSGVGHQWVNCIFKIPYVIGQ